MTDPNSAWGPKTWNFLHAIALTYPQKADKGKQDAMIAMLRSLEGVIPCATCREHYKEWFSQTESTKTAFDGQENLFNALVDFHNAVNIRKTKPPTTALTLTYKKAHDIHGQFPPANSVCPSNKNNDESNISILDRRFLLIAIALCVVIGIITHRHRIANKQAKETQRH